MSDLSAPKAPYHHGDLRQVMIEHARQSVERDGLAKLSLRKLAAAVGVSHNAPYMHFKSKGALLDAVATDGFAKLREAIAQAGGGEEFSAQNWRPRVLAGLAAYVRFAQDNPALYALMHQPALSAPDMGAGNSVADAGKGTLDSLGRTMEAGQRLGLVRAGDTGGQALWVWSTLHGLAGVTSFNRQVFGDRSPQDVTAQVLGALLEGLAP